MARKNSLRYGRTLDDEMRILILHGILHLMGYDHETDTGQMERRERRLRRALGLSLNMPIFLYTLGVLALTIGLAVFSYLDRVYREFGHVTTGRIHRHLETFEAEIEPRFKMERRQGRA